MNIRILTLLLFAGTTIPLASQVLNPKAQVDHSILYRDSEQWIKERFKYFYEERANPLGYIPDGVREEAWVQSKKMSVHKPNVFSKRSAFSSQQWTVVGPNNVGGRITGIAIHPTNPDIVYFTGADGGVWKSVNGGASYTPISEDLPTMAMGSIDIDPNNPDNIWVGTGEANGSGDSYPGIGVVRSTDAGNTWSLVGSKFADQIGSIKVHKSNGNIVFAATRQGLWRTTNAGFTWTRLHTNLAHDLVLHPTNHEVVYAAIQGIGVQKSVDSGATWTTLSLPIQADSIGRIAIDLCLTQPNVIYAVIVSGRGTSNSRGVFKSTNDGVTWQRTIYASPNFFSSQGWYNCEIAVHPSNPNIVLVGGVSFYGSTDGGFTWATRGGMHVDHHAVEFSLSNHSIAYFGNDGGMYKSTNGGVSFINQNIDLPITQFYELGIALQDPEMMIGGTQDNGSKFRKTNNANWNNATGGDGAYCVIDYTDAKYIYTEYQNGSHLRSTNGGTSFSAINNGLVGSGLWVTPVAIHPTEPTVLFTATTRQLYKTTNRGTLWFPFHGNMDSTSSINYIAISPTNPDLMLCGYTNGRIWKTTDAGASWTNISTGLPSRTCKDIQFDPFDANTYYTCYSGYASTGVYKTTDGGTSWISITGSGTNALPTIPKNALAIDPTNSNNIFVGTDFGVYATTNGGATWEVLGTGMPKVVIADLELHPLNGVLYAATHGRSTFALTVTTPVEFTSFSAVPDGNQVHLSWRTAAEVNNYGFSVERMNPMSGGWQEIGFVEGHGSTAGVNLYAFTDKLLPLDAETLIYRLRQIDFDGKFEYSPEVMVTINDVSPNDFELEQNFPNPFNPVTNIRYSLPATERVRLTVTDAKGRTVKELVNKVQQAGMHVVSFDANDVPSGAYFYHLEYDGKRQTKKMMVLK